MPVAALLNGPAGLLHEMSVIVEVVQRIETETQDLARNKEVAKIGPGVMPTGLTPTRRIHR